MISSRFAALCCLFVMYALATTPSQAAFIFANGNSITLRGMIVEGDAERLQAVLQRTDPRRQRVIYLESSGGEVRASVSLAKLIRKERLVTAVDSSRTHCDSGCTLAFVAGVRRHYIHGDRVHEGLSGAYYGLGFHPAHQRFGGRIPGHASTRASAELEKIYRMMGTPGAVELMNRAAFNTYFRPNGHTALKMRIATSLSEP